MIHLSSTLLSIFFLRKPNNSPSSLPYVAVLPIDPFCVAAAGMGKKPADKKKQTAATKEANTVGSKRGAELSKRRSKDVVFTPSNLSCLVILARYGYLWGRPLEKGHGAPVVYVAEKVVLQDSY